MGKKFVTPELNYRLRNVHMMTGPPMKESRLCGRQGRHTNRSRPVSAHHLMRSRQCFFLAIAFRYRAPVSTTSALSSSFASFAFLYTDTRR